MSSKSYDEEAIFKVACQIASPAARAVYLSQVCGDTPAVLERITALLRVQDEESRFLESPPPGLANYPTINQPPERPGTQIGAYKLLQQIGEGGMGVVYMAEQTEPVQRKVALKVIKPGMDSRQVIARFEAERQALALMDHVNIARVLDAGATESGRPYFVMELVHGVPITKYCDDNRLTPRQRLELFVPVCQAIQHAHQKGIIHRDIKPSNVMVTLYDGQPVPKVIDFGVAKATEQKLTERTLFTQYGTMVGTLEYMSPEQAEMSALGVDTRSDIYSLGVLLYELLTGSTPLSSKRMKEAAYAEILRLIKEEEPPKPSTRLSESGEHLASISAQRHTEPAKLSKLMRGELDWIVMKTLEKDRNRRYETASGFADDVQRYLDDEPVQACPPSVGYRLRKFVRRNRVAITTAALVAVTLVLGSVISTWQAIRATRAEGLAQARLIAETDARNEAEAARTEEAAQRAAADEQRLDAERQRQQAEDARKQATANLKKAREAVDQMLTRVAERLGDQPALESVRRDLLEDALKFYQEFLQQKSTDSSIRAETGLAYFRVGEISRYLIGDYSRAKEPFAQAIPLLEHAVADFPAMLEYRDALGRCHNGLGNCLVNAGQLEEAEQEHQRARKQFEQLERVPLSLQQQRSRRQELAWTAFCLGGVLERQRRPDEAAKAYGEVIALCEKLDSEFPNDFFYPHWIAYSSLELGDLLSANRPQEALQLYQQAADRYEKMAAQFPDRQNVNLLLARSYSGLGSLLAHLGRTQEALAANDQALLFYRRAAERYERLAAQFPDRPQILSARVASYSELASLASRQGKLDEAIASYKNAIELDSKFANAHNGLGIALYRQGKLDEAIACYRKAVELDPKLANAHNNLGHALVKKGQMEEAIASYGKAVELDPKIAGSRNELAWLLATCPDPKFRDPKRAVELAQKSVELAPKTGSYWNTLGIAHYRATEWMNASDALTKSDELLQGEMFSFNAFFLAMAHWQLGEKDAARKWYDQAALWMEKNKPEDEELKRFREEAAELLRVKEEAKSEK